MPHRQLHRGEEERSCASSANLFTFACCPPWAGIDRDSVLTELDIEHGLTRSHRGHGGGDLTPASHSSHWLPGQDKLSGINGYPFHPHQQHMIPAACVQDQELSVGPEGTRVNDEPVTGGGDLGAGPGRDRKAFFCPSHVVRV